MEAGLARWAIRPDKEISQHSYSYSKNFCGSLICLFRVRDAILKVCKFTYRELLGIPLFSLLCLPTWQDGVANPEKAYAQEVISRLPRWKLLHIHVNTHEQAGPVAGMKVQRCRPKLFLTTAKTKLSRQAGWNFPIKHRRNPFYLPGCLAKRASPASIYKTAPNTKVLWLATQMKLLMVFSVVRMVIWHEERSRPRELYMKTLYTDRSW